MGETVTSKVKKTPDKTDWIVFELMDIIATNTIVIKLRVTVDKMDTSDCPPSATCAGNRLLETSPLGTIRT